MYMIFNFGLSCKSKYTFRKLVPVALEYMLEIVIPTLLENLDETKDLYTRHGSLVAIGFVVRGIADVASTQKKSLQDYIGEL